MATLYGFECWDLIAKRWDASLCGEQSRSNCFETREAAEERLGQLAECMDDMDVSRLRVVPIEFL
jgi:hypothetical protein